MGRLLEEMRRGCYWKADLRSTELDGVTGNIAFLYKALLTRPRPFVKEAIEIINNRMNVDFRESTEPDTIGYMEVNYSSVEHMFRNLKIADSLIDELNERLDMHS